MILTKRQINTKLSSTVLSPRKTESNQHYLKDFKIKVIRARNVPYKSWVGRRTVQNEKTLVTIEISGKVKSTKGTWIGVHQYGPRHIRNYLRKGHNGVVSAVSSWVKLWGFDNEVELERIKLNA
tara:strand:- start:235 stop:606 length:372 start_codon:yes stop_codon:yes gene_type:complete